MPKTTPKLIEDSADMELMSRSSGMPTKTLLPWLLLLLVIIAAAVGGYWQYNQSNMLKQQLAKVKTSSQQAAQDEAKQLIARVGKLIVLPDEQPTIATVSDLAPLKDQAFFANAKIGDKVLIFATAKKAILYRPSEDKIIEVAPINLDTKTTQPPTTKQPGASITPSTSTTSTSTKTTTTK